MNPADTASANVANTPWENPQQRPLIEIAGLSKRFGDFIAVDNVDLKIYRRELFTILGGSGCGKRGVSALMAWTSPTCRPTSARST